MKTAIMNLNKTSVKQLITVSGVILVPLLIVILVLMVKLGAEIGTGEFVMMGIIAGIMMVTGAVGKEYF